MPGKALHILLSAYDCKPHAGTEAGNGWGWAVHLAARGLRVHVVTRASNQEAVRAELASGSYGELTFSFVQAKPTGLKEAHGPHYLAWQFAAWRAVRPLHRRDPFDVAHHVTYGSIHVPTQMWRLRIPVLFGPVGGGQVSPYRLREYFGKDQRKELVRTLFTKSLVVSLLHRRWMRRMDVVYAGNQETLELARALGSHNVVLAMDTGLPEEFFSERPRVFAGTKGQVRLLWAGRMLPRKALLLTLDALAATQAETHLTILGDGYTREQMQQFLSERKLEDRVTWSGGRVPWAEVREAYATHDAFLFTSIRDSCGSQLLEAMALGLPIITLDHQGAHCLVPADAGFKVPVSDKAGTVRAVAEAIETFAALPDQDRNHMSEAAWKTARTLAWKERAARTEIVYRTLVREQKTPSAGRTGLADLPAI